uniref:Pyridoxal phosphate phosphatase PHOSPHO2 n=1 Tax=Biomphalaria glabrata TaxID=6526 RepID=A0A2C9JMV3_BIOGL
MAAPTTGRLLLVFDFDHSLIDENSDTYICKLAPGGTLPDEIKELYKEDGWTEYMAEIFKFLHSNGCTKETLISCLSEIPLTEGMKELLSYTKATENCDHIIISDANSVFIEHILKHHDIFNVIDQVFTNPAQFNQDDCLELQPYHFQDWCTLSTKNLCKGHILKTFLTDQTDRGVFYRHIIYVGDGHNDLCPGLVLRPEDIFMPRLGFTLIKLIEKIRKKNKPVKLSELQASIVPWQTGLDILAHIKALE